GTATGPASTAAGPVAVPSTPTTTGPFMAALPHPGPLRLPAFTGGSSAALGRPGQGNVPTGPGTDRPDPVSYSGLSHRHGLRARLHHAAGPLPHRRRQPGGPLERGRATGLSTGVPDA